MDAATVALVFGMCAGSWASGYLVGFGRAWVRRLVNAA